ncbi:MAG: Uncharacterised protein [Synechococcus sp. MIT S9220]|nr:MAG: Uncharacterised protein [Synechococcus sp. MIT S9220]
MQLRAEPRPNQADQRIRCKHEDHRHQQQQGTDTGVQCRKDVSSLALGPAAEHADHGAVKRPVDSPEQDQQKPGQHIGVVVRVVSRAHSKCRSNHQLTEEAAKFAEEGSEGDHQSDPLE